MPFPPKKPAGAMFSPKEEIGAPDSLDKPSSAELPAEEAPPEEGAGGVEPNPEAVDYRTEAETCQHCEYLQSDTCTHPMVAQQVGPGDSCAAFESKEGMGGEGAELPGEQEAELPGSAPMPAYR